ncbi:DUF3027 domain-containing protein [Nesterenkonia lutea]|uniref:DUF3027 domain-containing protein n=1 Tax=Nesterenkonia lutea TaxID=272919 RepID=A0ABR9JAG3_9MICC|nr:DUF3027 domain-containing protein [Nesterenkonia lutea]MBE1522917.1 hypothetical protein [Nesterenkonia lutea]
MTEQTSIEESGAEQTVSAAASSSPEHSGTGTGTGTAPRPRRAAKPKADPVLAESVELAREALVEIAAQAQIGMHLGVRAEGDRLLTHRFAADKPGYRGWEWFVTVARAPRAKKVTVCELGILPGQDALIAPEWVPWLERMNDEEKEAHRAEQAESAED